VENEGGKKTGDARGIWGTIEEEKNKKPSKGKK